MKESNHEQVPVAQTSAATISQSSASQEDTVSAEEKAWQEMKYSDSYSVSER